MADANLSDEINKRRTFAIISHPDAGKTTLTEKLLLWGGAINEAGEVKSRKTSRHATSDWMALEQQRGISVTTSVMQFPYHQHIINLLDTPGHEDFSEDTYRTLTAVDTAIMVIDSTKGVEKRTIKLLDVCRLRNTPILTFMNKMDRDTLEPIDLMDEVERTLQIKCAPITWPISMGKSFKGVYHLLDDTIYLYQKGMGLKAHNYQSIKGLNNPALDEKIGSIATELREEIELVQGASHCFDLSAFLKGELSPVFFGTALGNFGISELLNAFVQWAPKPQARVTDLGEVNPLEPTFSGFVFKIQANMDPMHRDRIAFLRICSGAYRKGIKVWHIRAGREVQLNQALTFLAGDRSQTEEAWPGDIIGLHNHGSIQIGDTFCQGKKQSFTGIPHFAPELFRQVLLKEPLKSKQLNKGLEQLCEEGATQVFRPLGNNRQILGAIGVLQFDVVAFRLAQEYRVDCSYDVAQIATARWIRCQDPVKLAQFKIKCADNLALDGANMLTYLAPTLVNLNLTMERWPDIEFLATREH